MNGLEIQFEKEICNLCSVSRKGCPTHQICGTHAPSSNKRWVHSFAKNSSLSLLHARYHVVANYSASRFITHEKWGPVIHFFIRGNLSIILCEDQPWLKVSFSKGSFFRRSFELSQGPISRLDGGVEKFLHKGESGQDGRGKVEKGPTEKGPAKCQFQILCTLSLTVWASQKFKTGKVFESPVDRTL